MHVSWLPLHRTISEAGRPRKLVSIEDILELRALNYNWTKIAIMLDISRATLYRRLEEAGISADDRTPLSNTELDGIITSIKQDHPNDGEVLIKGHLISRGIRVSRQALRDSIHRVDHERVDARRGSVIHRRVYSVPHPNSVWHIDGHHKLIRWRFVIHGAIDGFSRTIIYLKCCDNNRALTVLESFTCAVSQFGLPDRVRSDYGGENTEVWKYMIAAHDLDYRSVITGSSVHNERVERLWRDVHRCIVSPFVEKFQALESNGVLDPLNEVDLYVLHLIFLPLLNKCISEFTESWNHHSLSSEANMTPFQLFFEGLIHVASNNGHNLGLLAPLNNVDVTDMIGDHLVVPRINFCPCDSLKQQLDLIEPSHIRTNDSIALYTRTIQFVGQHLIVPCNRCTLN